MHNTLRKKRSCAINSVLIYWQMTRNMMNKTATIRIHKPRYFAMLIKRCSVSICSLLVVCVCGGGSLLFIQQMPSLSHVKV